MYDEEHVDNLEIYESDVDLYGIDMEEDYEDYEEYDEEDYEEYDEEDYEEDWEEYPTGRNVKYQLKLAFIGAGILLVLILLIGAGITHFYGPPTDITGVVRKLSEEDLIRKLNNHMGLNDTEITLDGTRYDVPVKIIGIDKKNTEETENGLLIPTTIQIGDRELTLQIPTLTDDYVNVLLDKADPAFEVVENTLYLNIVYEVYAQQVKEEVGHNLEIENLRGYDIAKQVDGTHYIMVEGDLNEIFYVQIGQQDNKIKMIDRNKL